MGNRTGTIIQRATQGPLAIGPDPGDSLFIAVLANRGLPNIPTLITSMPRFASVFGTSYVPSAANTTPQYHASYDVLESYFGKGGRRAYVVRIVDGDAETADVTLQDRDGSPQDTITVKGKGPGTWANSYRVVISDGALTDTFKIEVYDGDPTVTTTNLLETWDNLKVVSGHIDRVNNGSDYIQLVDEESATAAPDNRPATGTFQLGTTTAGVDGNEPDAAEIVGTESVGTKTGLKAFKRRSYGRGAYILPDLDSDATVKAEIATHLEKYWRIYLVSSTAGASVSTAQTERAAIDNDFMAFYYPRVRSEDRATENVRAIPATGQIWATWLREIGRKGRAKAPAGPAFDVSYRSLGLETLASGEPLIDDPVAELLMSKGINPIWNKGDGEKVHGARAAGSTSGWKNIMAAYVWCVIASNIKPALDSLEFENADELLYEQIRIGTYNFMAGLYDDGAFRGLKPGLADDPDPEVHGFGVACSEDLLSEADLLNDNVRVHIWFREKRTNETTIVELAKDTTP